MLSKLFNQAADQILNYENIIPKEIVIEDKLTLEQMELIQQLDKEDKSTVFKIIDKMLTTKKFKDFFNKNAAAL
ncbi:transcriptional regulator [Chryseobacterium sp. Tr-659]|uniref:transcriptional regulator n=1 Tax=Chryseobacterium sp. Tr-659 TaxID=2608340 RepID=UPI00141F768D|nr:transcriptional regulator [Chryseobacterium sp. Tr-659]NIF05288.1 transcriptional regulator [Chryseobacterium sp. Tr-659]